MSEPFIGEIQAFAFGAAPAGWLVCDGQMLDSQNYSELYAVIGTTYGGSGSTNFALPNLMGRTPMGVGAGPQLTSRERGEKVGEASVPLTINNFPPHTHALNVVSNKNADLEAAAGHYLSKGNKIAGAKKDPINTYYSFGIAAKMAADAIEPAGAATVTHDNMQPYLPVLLCIAFRGEFPPRPLPTADEIAGAPAAGG